MFPSDFVGPGIGLDSALEVDVVALLDVGGVQAGAKHQARAGRDWNKKQKKRQK